MTKRVPVAVLLLTSAFALGGCQLFKPNSGSFAASAKAAEAERQASSTDQGREHLRAGRYGQAIVAFDRALAHGEAPAAAYNGLGVAYAKLGRADLAYRFFKKATMADPENPAYSRNLAALLDSPSFHLALIKRAEPKVAAAPPAPSVRAPGKLYRDANKQFTLVTQPDAAPAGPAAAQAAASCGARSGCQKVAMPVAASRRVAPAKAVSKDSAAAGTVPAAEAVTGPAKRKTIDLPASKADAAPADS